MTALAGYAFGLLLRSQRWVAPVLLYAGLVAISLSGQPRLSDQLGWNAAMLVPALGWLSRLALGAQPSAARAVLAAAAGSGRRPQLAALGVLLGCGLGLVAVADGLSAAVCAGAAGGAAGPLAAVVCAASGSALGALCAVPPVVRAGAGTLGLLAGSVLLLVAPFSPANAAVRATFASGGVEWWPLPTAALLAAAAWSASAYATPRRHVPD
ncbi:hypothetical protein [Phaeacidiphilus oryzae]|uniref:hypothetical protein n=1 Tax=Phaeacidiphilus oryzae TaxID=348818 RepID=UPI000567EDE9|nr:hypothetical protein [Phaeacidiphilus oryzae]